MLSSTTEPYFQGFCGFDNRLQPVENKCAACICLRLKDKRYAITSTDNEKLGANIREIGTGYVDGFVGTGEDIFFTSSLVDQDQVSPLKRTLKDPLFDHIFQKATDVTISGMSNPARACVFYIDPSNCKFRFSDLKDFIINNIGSYVFSRAQTKRITDRNAEGEKLGLTSDELAFYDALTKPQAIKDFYEHDELIAITKELTDLLRKNRTIDWQKKESARAGMRRLVKRLLKKHKYPPEGMDDAVQTVMSQCEMWTDNVMTA